MAAKTFFRELYWLLLLLFISVLMVSVAFNWHFPSGSIDIHIHETYYVIPTEITISCLFLFLTFLTYSIKSRRQQFSSKVANFMMFLSGGLLMTLMAFGIRELGRQEISFSGGWTSYPPLSSLQQAAYGAMEHDPTAVAIGNIFIVLQMVIAVFLIYAGFQWGRKYPRPEAIHHS